MIAVNVVVIRIIKSSEPNLAVSSAFCYCITELLSCSVRPSSVCKIPFLETGNAEVPPSTTYLQTIFMFSNIKTLISLFGGFYDHMGVYVSNDFSYKRS